MSAVTLTRTIAVWSNDFPVQYECLTMALNPQSGVAYGVLTATDWYYNYLNDSVWAADLSSQSGSASVIYNSSTQGALTAIAVSPSASGSSSASTLYLLSPNLVQALTVSGVAVLSSPQLTSVYVSSAGLLPSPFSAVLDSVNGLLYIEDSSSYYEEYLPMSSTLYQLQLSTGSLQLLTQITYSWAGADYNSTFVDCQLALSPQLSTLYFTVWNVGLQSIPVGPPTSASSSSTGAGGGAGALSSSSSAGSAPSFLQPTLLYPIVDGTWAVAVSANGQWAFVVSEAAALYIVNLTAPIGSPNAVNQVYANGSYYFTAVQASLSSSPQLVYVMEQFSCSILVFSVAASMSAVTYMRTVSVWPESPQTDISYECLTMSLSPQSGVLYGLLTTALTNNYANLNDAVWAVDTTTSQSSASLIYNSTQQGVLTAIATGPSASSGSSSATTLYLLHTGGVSSLQASGTASLTGATLTSVFQSPLIASPFSAVLDSVNGLLYIEDSVSYYEEYLPMSSTLYQLQLSTGSLQLLTQITSVYAGADYNSTFVDCQLALSPQLSTLYFTVWNVGLESIPVGPPATSSSTGSPVTAGAQSSSAGSSGGSAPSPSSSSTGSAPSFLQPTLLYPIVDGTWAVAVSANGQWAFVVSEAAALYIVNLTAPIGSPNAVNQVYANGSYYFTAVQASLSSSPQLVYVMEQFSCSILVFSVAASMSAVTYMRTVSVWPESPQTDISYECLTMSLSPQSGVLYGLLTTALTNNYANLNDAVWAVDTTTSQSSASLIYNSTQQGVLTAIATGPSASSGSSSATTLYLLHTGGVSSLQASGTASLTGATLTSVFQSPLIASPFSAVLDSVNGLLYIEDSVSYYEEYLPMSSTLYQLQLSTGSLQLLTQITSVYAGADYNSTFVDCQLALSPQLSTLYFTVWNVGLESIPVGPPATSSSTGSPVTAGAQSSSAGSSGGSAPSPSSSSTGSAPSFLQPTLLYPIVDGTWAVAVSANGQWAFVVSEAAALYIVNLTAPIGSPNAVNQVYANGSYYFTAVQASLSSSPQLVYVMEQFSCSILVFSVAASMSAVTYMRTVSVWPESPQTDISYECLTMSLSPQSGVLYGLLTTALTNNYANLNDAVWAVDTTTSQSSASLIYNSTQQGVLTAIATGPSASSGSSSATTLYLLHTGGVSSLQASGTASLTGATLTSVFQSPLIASPFSAVLDSVNGLLYIEDSVSYYEEYLPMSSTLYQLQLSTGSLQLLTQITSVYAGADYNSTFVDCQLALSPQLSTLYFTVWNVGLESIPVGPPATSSSTGSPVTAGAQSSSAGSSGGSAPSPSSSSTGSAPSFLQPTLLYPIVDGTWAVAVSANGQWAFVVSEAAALYIVNLTAPIGSPNAVNQVYANGSYYFTAVQASLSSSPQLVYVMEQFSCSILVFSVAASMSAVTYMRTVSVWPESPQTDISYECLTMSLSPQSGVLYGLLTTALTNNYANLNDAVWAVDTTTSQSSASLIYNSTQQGVLTAIATGPSASSGSSSATTLYLLHTGGVSSLQASGTASLTGATLTSVFQSPLIASPFSAVLDSVNGLLYIEDSVSYYEEYLPMSSTLYQLQLSTGSLQLLTQITSVYAGADYNSTFVDCQLALSPQLSTLYFTVWNVGLESIPVGPPATSSSTGSPVTAGAQSSSAGSSGGSAPSPSSSSVVTAAGPSSSSAASVASSSSAAASQGSSSSTAAQASSSAAAMSTGLQLQSAGSSAQAASPSSSAAAAPVSGGSSSSSLSGGAIAGIVIGSVVGALLLCALLFFLLSRRGVKRQTGEDGSALPASPKDGQSLQHDGTGESDLSQTAATHRVATGNDSEDAEHGIELTSAPRE